MLYFSAEIRAKQTMELQRPNHIANSACRARSYHSFRRTSWITCDRSTAFGNRLLQFNDDYSCPCI